MFYVKKKVKFLNHFMYLNFPNQVINKAEMFPPVVSYNKSFG